MRVIEEDRSDPLVGYGDGELVVRWPRGKDSAEIPRSLFESLINEAECAVWYRDTLRQIAAGALRRRKKAKEVLKRCPGRI